MKTRPLPNDVIEGFTTQLAESLRRELENLSKRITESAGDELSQVAIPEPEAEQRTPAALARAVAAIRDGQGQAAVLRSLLAGAAAIGARTAVFVIKPEGATLWESTGFEHEEAHTGAFSGHVLGSTEPAVGAVLESGHSVFIQDGAPHPTPDFGQAARRESGLIPLKVHEKTAAVVFVDRAEEEVALDRTALEILVSCAGLAVERLALARMAGAGGRATGTETRFSGPVEARPEESPSSFVMPVSEEESASQDSGVIPIDSGEGGSFELEPQPADDDDPDVEHAQRYARLVIEEIVLYHSDKVDRGRAEGDLLALLGDEIDQARKYYDQQISLEVREKGDFFQQALVKVLAEGNSALLSSH